MKNLELYAGLLAGGLGTGYNLIQGDSLPSALAQGAILGSAVGGGMYGARVMSDGLLKATNEIGSIPDYYRYNPPYSIDVGIEEGFTASVPKELRMMEDVEKLNNYARKVHNKAQDYKTQLDSVNQLTNNYHYMFMPVGGLTGGMTINDILFQDKSEREQAQLLSELELLKANGSISPYLDDYLMRNS